MLTNIIVASENNILFLKALPLLARIFDLEILIALLNKFGYIKEAISL